MKKIVEINILILFATFQPFLDTLLPIFFDVTGIKLNTFENREHCKSKISFQNIYLFKDNISRRSNEHNITWIIWIIHCYIQKYTHDHWIHLNIEVHQTNRPEERSQLWSPSDQASMASCSSMIQLKPCMCLFYIYKLNRLMRLQD